MIRTVGRWMGRGLAVLIAAVAGLWLLGPREPVDLATRFDATVHAGDLDAALARSESRIPDLLPHARKRIVWAGVPGQKTPLALVYLHGFSASAEEIRPVPDRVAQALGANLYFARFTGHGRGDPDALARGSVNDWLRDTAEALAIGRRIGQQTVILSTSTGGTLAALALTQPDLREGVRGAVFVSPNFAIQSPAAPLLSLPAARQILPRLVGARRSWTPANALHGRYWTTDYPTTALVPVAAAVRAFAQADPAQIPIPALFYFSDDDQVVDARKTRQVAQTWGAPVRVRPVTLLPGDDPGAHVIAGAVMSPQNTDAAVAAILDWIKAL